MEPKKPEQIVASRPLPSRPDDEKRHHHVTPETEGRRTFVASFIAIAAGAVSVLAPLGAGVMFLAGPLWRREPESGNDVEGEGFIRLAITASSLPADGTPQQACVCAERMDAWNHLPKQSIGTVWARRDAQGQVVVFTSICPHLGCSVEYRGAQKDFSCPCHNSAFDLEGARQNAIPPRSLDALETKVVEDVIWVKYQTFRGGIAEKIAL